MKGQWSSIWWTDSPSIWQSTHQWGDKCINGLLLWSISIVLIQPRVVVHEKAFTRGGASSFQIIRWGKERAKMLGEERAMKKDLEENFPEYTRVQTLLSSILLDKKTSLKESRREVTDWASQSNKSLDKRRFHDEPWSELEMISATVASFWEEVMNNLGNKDTKGESPHHISFQNLIKRPSPCANLVWGRNKGYNLQMFFYKRGQLEEGRWEQSHPLKCSPYFWDIVDCHKESLSKGNR